MGSTYERTSGDQTSRGLAEQSGRVIEDIRDLGHMAASSAGEAVKGLRNQSAEALRSGKQKALELRDNLQTRVSANPWKSVFIAAGVGALIGFALRRAR